MRVGPGFEPDSCTRLHDCTDLQADDIRHKPLTTNCLHSLQGRI